MNPFVQDQITAMIEANPILVGIMIGLFFVVGLMAWIATDTKKDDHKGGGFYE